MARTSLYETMNNTGFPGNHFCNPALAEPVTTAWEADRGGRPPATVFRLLPAASVDGSETPMFQTTPSGDQLVPTDWHIRLRCWKSWGNPKITFPVENIFSENDQYNPSESPPGLILKTVYDMCKMGSAPQAWLKYREGRDAILPEKRDLTYMGLSQVLLYWKYEQFTPPKGGAPEDKPQLLVFSDSASQTLVSQLCQSFRPDSNGMESSSYCHEFVQALTHGDVVGLMSNQAKFICMYPDSIENPDVIFGMANQTPRGGAMGIGQRRVTPQGGGKDKKVFASYAMKTYQSFLGQSATMQQHEAEYIHAKIRPWEQLLTFPDKLEQVRLLSRSVPYDILAYAWSDFPDWIPQRGSAAHTAGVAAVTVGMGGFGVPAVQPQGVYGGDQYNMQPPAVYGQPQYDPQQDPQYDQAGYDANGNMIADAYAQEYGQPQQYGQPAQYGQPQGYPDPVQYGQPPAGYAPAPYQQFVDSPPAVVANQPVPRPANLGIGASRPGGSLASGQSQMAPAIAASMPQRVTPQQAVGGLRNMAPAVGAPLASTAARPQQQPPVQYQQPQQQPPVQYQQPQPRYQQPQQPQYQQPQQPPQGQQPPPNGGRRLRQ